AAVETHLMTITLPLEFVVAVTDDALNPDAMHEALLVSFSSVPLYLHELMSPEDLMVNTRLAPLFTIKPPLLGTAPKAARASCPASRSVARPRVAESNRRDNCR